MNYDYKGDSTPSRAKGIAFVIGLHALLVYGLVSGLGRKAVEIIKKPLEATVIQEVKLPPPPPPPPPPPKPIEKPIVPKVEAPPPPPFVPPPEVTPPPTEAPAIVSTPAPPPEPVVIAPPPPPAPPAPAPAPAGPVSVGVACETTVKPEMPRKALQDGTGGLVKVLFTIQGGSVKDVTVVSGPRVFQSAVRAAIMQYKCLKAADGTVVSQEFDFKVE